MRNHYHLGASVQRIIAAFIFAALLCACGTDNAGNAADPDRTVLLPPSQIELTAALTPFESCEPFLRHVKNNALDMVSPWGIGGGYFPETMEAEMLRGSPQAIADAAPSVPEVEYSTTNIQEAGVDEPDIVKTDGRRIIALVDNTLHVIDATGKRLHQLGEFQFKKFWAQDMFLSGDRVVVFGQIHDTTPLLRSIHPQPGWYSPITTLISVDISKKKPRITRRLHIDGNYISSRLVSNAARIVIQSNPTGLEWVFPNGSGLRAEREAKEQNRQLIKESTIDNWVPWFALEDSEGQLLKEGTLTTCERIYHPASNSGLQMLNIVTVDLGEELFEKQLASTSVLADGQTVYSSTNNLYVATTEWFDERQLRADRETSSDQPPTIKTRIHKFDISDPTNTLYRSSGQVIGTVLNQYSMSEHNDHLRVATTNHGWWSPQPEVTSESFVTVLKETDSGLSEVGRVGNIGKGERIYAVRFLGDIATVVTFRQTDPLYTIDLSQPESPKVLGELKIMGYSAYLHPITDNLLLGVGQDASDIGQRLGTQVSLFDISDLSKPIRVDQWQLPGGTSEIEYNARAFLYWPNESLFVLPITTHQIATPDGDAFSGAIALELNGQILGERGRITHLKSDPKVTCQRWLEEREDETEIERQHCWADFDWRGTIRRSLVIDGEIHSLSSLGLLTSDLETLKPLSFLAF
tara:strand:- start:1950 stop:4028 length:2079 start_codon:yes stop_codon:yes gene_type:complete